MILTKTEQHGDNNGIICRLSNWANNQINNNNMTYMQATVSSQSKWLSG